MHCTGNFEIDILLYFRKRSPFITLALVEFVYTVFIMFRAPPGCQQYYMARSGKITSMNFMRVTGSTPSATGQNTGVHLATSQ